MEYRGKLNRVGDGQKQLLVVCDSELVFDSIVLDKQRDIICPYLSPSTQNMMKLAIIDLKFDILVNQ